MTKRAWNPRTRLLLTLELAVVLPAATLIYFSVAHLNRIKRDHGVEAAIQRDFSQVLAISEKEMNHKAVALLDDVKADLPSPGEACGPSLDKLLAAHPYVAHIYLYDPQRGQIFRSQPSRLRDPQFRAEAEDLQKMNDAGLKVGYDEYSKEMEKGHQKGKPYFYESNWPSRGDKRIYETVAMFVKHDAETGHKVITGIVFDGEYLRDHFFPEMLDSIISHNTESQNEKNPAVMMIHAKSDPTPIATSQGWDGGEPAVERNFDGAFPGLTLAMKMRGTTLAAMEQHFVTNSFLILGGLSLVLAGGIFLTYRNINKEIALARLKSDFVSNVSHDLRTPLSLIRLYAETLELGRLTDPAKYQEYYQIIRKESERLTALINNILDFSRIEAGRKEYEFRETDLAELVKNTMESYRFQIEQHGFTLDQNIEPVPPMRVDREAVARSLVNLINNALKYSQDRKFIGVNLYRANGTVKLEVVDHGIGIPLQEQAKIFEKFYRVGDPLVHNTKGSGLGLSLVQHIVKAHGGQVSVDSSPGEGSKFTISLPVAQPANAQAASAQTP